MRLRPTPVLLVAVLLAIVSPELNAQTTTSGELDRCCHRSEQCSCCLDARVEIRDTAKGTPRLTKTDREGVYRLLFLTRDPR